MDHKKALRRAYKERSITPSVFVFTAPNGHQYVGYANEFNSKVNSLRVTLNGGRHPNHALQADWNEYGESGFTIEQVDTLTIEPGAATCDYQDDLRELRDLWVAKLNAKELWK